MSVFPNLYDVNVFAIDTETYDPELMTKGCGAFHNNGHLVGVSIATDDGAWYWDAKTENLRAYLQDLLGDPHKTAVMHNAVYDLQWLQAWGIDVRCKLVDTMYAEALLDEAKASYSLDATAMTHLREGKADDELYQWLADRYGGAPTRKVQGGRMHLAPEDILAPYAIQDADLTYRIWQKQEVLLEKDGLMDVMRLECGLIPVLVGMRKRGIRVDVEKAEKLYTRLEMNIHRAVKTLSGMAGFTVNVNRNADLVKLFDKLHIPYSRTDKGNPSFAKDALLGIDNPVISEILNIRKWEKFNATFLKGYIMDSHIDGRVYGEFHPLRSDDGGTVSGRFSSSKPNLQNIPSNDPTLGALVRGCFLPEVGEQWVSIDYSQIEYRLLCHFGRGASAENARQAYTNDPRTDYHQLVADMTGLSRKVAKTINFSKAYGAGAKTLSEQMGCSEDEARTFIDKYDEQLPFVKELLERQSSIAQGRPIRTILGRLCRFDLYVPRKFEVGVKPLSKPEATIKWGLGNIRKYKIHAALNRLIQGSAADLFKKALLDGYEQGMYSDDCFGVPLALVHDELCFSVPKECIKHIPKMVNIMTGALDLKVPLTVDVEIGDDWGHLDTLDIGGEVL